MGARWSRRQVLRAIGAAAAIPAAPMWAACARRGGRAAAPAAPLRQLDDLRQQLRELQAGLARAFPWAAASLTVARRGSAAVDAAERGVDQVVRAGAVFSADGAARHEVATSDLTADGLARAAAELLARAGGARGPAAAPAAAPQEVALVGRLDPRDQGPAVWLERVEALHKRAGRLGGSRVIYRGAYLQVDDDDSLFVGDGRDLAQRIVRVRAGVLLVATAGATATADGASRIGTVGLEALAIDDDELAAAADRALALLSARQPAAGAAQVVLDPTVSALLAQEGLGPALLADGWVAGSSSPAARAGGRIGAEAVGLVDDPTLAGGYGSYGFDDEGWPAVPTTLVAEGVVRGALTDRTSARLAGLPRTANGRRAGLLGAVAPRASNLAFAPGRATDAELIAAVRDGYLLESGLDAAGDPGRLAVTLRAARAREIHGGKLTGRLYGPCTLRGALPELLEAVGGVSAAGAASAAGGGGPAAGAGGRFLLTRAALAWG